jgi:hypothetical protein
LGPVQSVAVLFVGLLILGGGSLIQSADSQVGGGSTSAAASTHAEPFASTQGSLPSNLAGINGTIWEDDSGGTCAECSYTVYLTPGGVSTPNSYFLAIWYLTDPTCPPAVGQELVHLDIGSNGTSLNNPGSDFIELCTRATNPIVQDCGQDQLWYVNNFTLTVTQTSISGQYQSQYWTWDTASDGSISNCSIEYNFYQSFTLTPVFSSANSSSGATTTPQQNTSAGNTSPVQTSGGSKTTSSSSSSSTTTSAHPGGSGYLWVEILAAASVLIVVTVATYWVVLRKRPGSLT